MRSFLISAIVALSLTGAAQAQESQSASNQPDDEVIAFGTKLGMDKGLSAFYAGDYETAEVEFEKSFRRIKRVEMLQEDGVRNAQQGAISSQLNFGLSEVSGQGGADSASQTNVSQVAADTASPGRTYFGERKTRDEDKGYPLYMAGLSQIQLGKFDEAKASLERSIVFNKRIPDAHFRLGLLALQRQNADEAKAQLVDLALMMQKCGECDAAQEIGEKQTQLAQLIARFSG